MLFLDVNLGEGKSARITIYDGEDYNQVVDEFSSEHNLNEKKVKKLRDVIKAQLS